ncbi:MAG: hypothetical protein AB7Y74_15755 [Syntrophorhabdus sp.]
MKTLCIIFSLLGFYFSCQSAFSEDGWVLWEKRQQQDVRKDGKAGSNYLDWEILNAFPAWQECDIYKQNLWKVKKATFTEIKEKCTKNKCDNKIISLDDGVPFESLNVIHQFSNETIGHQYLKWFCLPGTLDPRERK